MTTEQDQISNDILGYLEQHQQMELLRFVSVGSVDVCHRGLRPRTR